MEEAESIESQIRHGPEHLCVLVHGLWGTPSHLAYMSKTLREKYSEDQLQILVAERNSNTYTYDGIDLGAERLAHEIEDALEEQERKGQQFKKLSMVGYSLGGLIARYAIGLLYSKGWFDKIEPVNFHTFATPHLGVKTPIRGYRSHIWNLLGGSTLSVSGHQLFLIDEFRDTQRPILSVLADPESVFIEALSKFKNRALYANVVNDRSAPYYTTYITKTDPFVDLDSIDIQYLKDYDSVIVDPNVPIALKKEEEPLSLYNRTLTSSHSLVTQLPLYAMLSVLIPVGTVVYLLNAGVQSVRSSKRIRLHEEGKAGIGLGSYRIPFMVQNAQSAIEGAFENMNAGQHQEYLPDSDEESATPNSSNDPGDVDEKGVDPSPTPASLTIRRLSRTRSRTLLDFPTLALSPEQFAMIDSLDAVGFKKYRMRGRRAFASGG
ncbi:hypothetical protein MMC06_003348 [Schaereria dolodes]|nr:hypothetical protein [Schaereria dolodes]